MITDLAELKDQSTISCDICIIGAGVAGITIAREFIGQDKKICLLESGGFNPEAEVQALYEGKNVGLPYFPPQVSRLRYFGGTSNHWGGFCRPLSDIDFKKRDWLPHSGWPITRADLVPYYERAQPVLQLGPFEYGAGYWIKKLEDEDYEQITFPSGKIVSSVFQFSPPTRFGTYYRSALEKADNVHVYLHANVVAIETIASPDNIDRVQAATFDGKTVSVRAKTYVLAAGGIENARLMLTSNQTRGSGLGNQNDLVGRYFMEHPHIRTGSIMFSKPNKAATSFYNSHYMRRLKHKLVSGYFSVAPEVREELHLLDNTMTLHPQFTLEEDSPGVQSMDRMARLIGSAQIPDRISESVKNIISDIDKVADVTYRRMFDEHPAGQEFRIGNQAEQSPNPNSRVMLDREKDRFGINRIKIDWRLSSLDKQSTRNSQQILAEELGRMGLGRVRVDLTESAEWPENLEGGFHHMGTTRMAANPKEGVVDADCRVHGLTNLYVAGSSVFPTVGKSNPTLTIVALAIRMADHLKVQ